MKSTWGNGIVLFSFPLPSFYLLAEFDEVLACDWAVVRQEIDDDVALAAGRGRVPEDLST